MEINIEKFKPTFFAESRMNLDAMERGILQVEAAGANRESLDEIFRAVHTLKGNSGTFGFTAVVSTAHRMESLLARTRKGDLELTAEVLECLLTSVDTLRQMLRALETGDSLDMEALEVGLGRLDALAQGGQVVGHKGWRIVFKPCATIFERGNDPLAIFSSLASLGTLTTRVHAENLPTLSDLDPVRSYLWWELELHGDAPLDLVEGAFEWVQDECDLEVSALGAPQPLAPQVPPEAPVAAPPPPQWLTPPGEALEGGFIRVAADKIEDVINMVGELVITQSMLSQSPLDPQEKRGYTFEDSLSLLERNMRDLQERVLRIRMVPVAFAYQPLPRLVRDLCHRLGKRARLHLSGETTELDKAILEKLVDPLVHLVRNCIDHGIESPDDRASRGKPQEGEVRLSAYHQAASFFLEVADDGRGIALEPLLERARKQGLVGTERPSIDRLHELLFLPGFSTAEVVTDVSGRGVGLDVVRRNIQALGGSVKLKSEEGRGSCFTLKLPLTLAIMEGQLVRSGEDVFVIPLLSIVESTLLQPERVRAAPGWPCLYPFQEEHIPVIRLAHLLGFEDETRVHGRDLMVILEAGGHRAGFLVDELLDQQQVVVKSLEKNFHAVPGCLGATILGDGSVALILDATGLIELFRETGNEEAGRTFLVGGAP